MKKMKLLLCGALLTGTLMGMSGCSSKGPDTKELFKNVSENMQKVKSMDADLLMDVDFKMAMGEDASMTMKMGIDGELQMVLDETADMHMKMDMDVSVLGQNQKTTTEMYQVNEDGQYVNYSSEDGELWTKTVIGEAEGIMDAFTSDDNLYRAIEDNPSMVDYEGTSKVKGKEAYEYSLTIDKKMFSSIFEEMLEDAEETDDITKEMIDMMKSDDFKIKISMFIYKEDETMAKISMDLGKSFDKLLTSIMESQMDASLEGMDLSFEKFVMAMECEYNKTDKISVPEEIKNSASEDPWASEEEFDESLISDIGQNADGTRNLQHFLDGGFTIVDEEDPTQILEEDGWAFFTIQRDDLVLFLEVDNESEVDTPAKDCQVTSISDWSGIY